MIEWGHLVLLGKMLTFLLCYKVLEWVLMILSNVIIIIFEEMSYFNLTHSMKIQFNLFILYVVCDHLTFLLKIQTHLKCIFQEKVLRLRLSGVESFSTVVNIVFKMFILTFYLLRFVSQLTEKPWEIYRVKALHSLDKTWTHVFIWYLWIRWISPEDRIKYKTFNIIPNRQYFINFFQIVLDLSLANIIIYYIVFCKAWIAISCIWFKEKKRKKRETVMWGRQLPMLSVYRHSWLWKN